MSTVATTDLLTNLWEELAAPSTRVFLQALRARGVSVRESDVREFVSSKSERQVLQPGNRYSGKVVAFYDGDRWAADLINYTSRPVVGADGKKYQHILICQDMFTRFIRTAPLTSVTEAEAAFAEMLKDTVPRSLSVDKGP